MVKVCKGGQNFSAMVGYITKDQGQAHYQIRTHNISRQELSFGRRDHDALLTSYDDSKKILNLKNLFNECYKFNMRCLHPAVAPVHYVLLYMIQSGSYMLSSDFISVHRKTDLQEARILWDMVHCPTEATLPDIMQMIFNPLSYGKKESKRYYMAGMHRLDVEESERIVAAPAANASASPSTPLGRVNTLLGIARSGTSYMHTPIPSMPEYVTLPDEDMEDGSFTIDRVGAPTGTVFGEALPSMQCPERLEDMLVIVRSLRESRLQVLQNAAIVTPAQVERPQVKSRANNFTFTNLADFE